MVRELALQISFKNIFVFLEVEARNLLFLRRTKHRMAKVPQLVYLSPYGGQIPPVRGPKGPYIWPKSTIPRQELEGRAQRTFSNFSLFQFQHSPNICYQKFRHPTGASFQLLRRACGLRPQLGALRAPSWWPSATCGGPSGPQPVAFSHLRGPFGPLAGGLWPPEFVKIIFY